MMDLCLPPATPCIAPWVVVRRLPVNGIARHFMGGVCQRDARSHDGNNNTHCTPPL
jgi:hypothetical protein